MDQHHHQLLYPNTEPGPARTAKLGHSDITPVSTNNCLTSTFPNHSHDLTHTIPNGYCPHWPPPEHLPYHVRRVDQQALDVLLRIEAQLAALLSSAYQAQKQATTAAPDEPAPPAKQNSTGNSSTGPKRGKGK